MRFISSVALFAGLLFFVSCAKQETLSNYELEQKAFTNWIENWKKENPADKDKLQKHSNGMYYILENSGAGAAVSPGNWVEVNYTGRDINGDVFVTRDKDITKIEGSYSDVVHYVPDFMYVSESRDYLTNMCKGMYDALVGLGLKKGAKIKLFIPSDLAYGAYPIQYHNGFQGQNRLGSNRQIILDVELLNVVSDADAYELELVQDFIDNDGGTWVPVKDGETDIEGLYLCVDTENDPAAEIVPDDISKSKTTIYFSGEFMDGHEFDRNVPKETNVLEMTEKLEGYGVSTTSISGYIEGFRKAVYSMKYNSSARVVMVSKHAYGANGGAENAIASQTPNTTARTVIRPHEPLVFKLYVAPKTEE